MILDGVFEHGDFAASDNKWLFIREVHCHLVACWEPR